MKKRGCRIWLAGLLAAVLLSGCAADGKNQATGDMSKESSVTELTSVSTSTQGSGEEATGAQGSKEVGDWEGRKVTVAVNEFIATTNRTDGTMDNPFVVWTETSRFLTGDQIDNEGAYRVLSEEAKANGGLLRIDHQPHFINGEPDPFGDEEKQEGKHCRIPWNGL